jgi:hypothetical protein
MLNYSITSCFNDSDCGNDQELQYTQTMFAKPSDKGKYYIKVVAAYGTEQKETFKTDAKYRIDEQGCMLYVEEHLSRSTFALRKTDAVAFVPHDTVGTTNVYPNTLYIYV